MYQDSKLSLRQSLVELGVRFTVGGETVEFFKIPTLMEDDIRRFGEAMHVLFGK